MIIGGKNTISTVLSHQRIYRLLGRKDHILEIYLPEKLLQLSGSLDHPARLS
jgi:hypothetical protein